MNKQLTTNSQTMDLGFLGNEQIDLRLKKRERLSTRYGRRVLKKAIESGVGALDEKGAQVFAIFAEKWRKSYLKDRANLPFRASTLKGCLSRFSDSDVRSLVSAYMPNVKRANFYEKDALASFQRLFSTIDVPFVKLRASGASALFVSPSKGVTMGKQRDNVSHSLDFGTILSISPTESVRVLVSHKFIGESGGAQCHQFEEMSRTHAAYAKFWQTASPSAQVANMKTMLFLICDGEQGARCIEKQSNAEHSNGKVFLCSSVQFPKLLATELSRRYPDLSPDLNKTLTLWKKGKSRFAKEGAGALTPQKEAEALGRINTFTAI